MAIVMINGRHMVTDRVKSIKRVTGGKYAVSASHGEFRIEGGRHLGGARREWFVEHDEWAGPVRCTSVRDAVRMIDGM